MTWANSTNDTSLETIRSEVEGGNLRFNDCYDQDGVFHASWANVTSCDSEQDSNACGLGSGILSLTRDGMYN